MISNSKYRADIDGLRAIAVLSVLFFHAFPTAMRGGFIGVDVFFVISGYLISGILYNDLERGTFSLSHFYERRIKRIFPALLLTLTASLALGWFVLPGDEYKQLGKHIAGSAGFVSNFVLWRESGYFDSASEAKPLLHLWSLGIEEQFYIVWPIVLWLVFQCRISPLIPALLLGILSFFLNLKGVSHDPAGTFYSPVTRFWELVAGGTLAWIHRQRRTHPHAPSLFSTNLSHVLSFVGFLMLLVGFFIIDRKFRFPGGWAVIPVIGSALLIGAGPHAYLNRYLLSNRYLRWIGLISYPLYLWHWPLLTFARIVQRDTPSAGVRAGALILAAALAWLTYRWIESPLRKGSTFPKTKVAVLLAGLLAIGTLGYLVYRRHGFPMRSTVAQLLEDERQVKSLAEDDEAAHDQCMKMYQLSGPIRFCNLSGSGKPHIALIGDSHARSLYYGLAEQLQDRGEGLLNIGGRLFLGAAVHPPNNDFEIKVYQGGIQATKFVAQEPSIDTVIMASMGLTYLLEHPDVIFQLLDRPDVTDRKKAWELALRQTLDAFVYTKKKVIFVVDNPEIDFDPRSCFPNRPLQFLRTQRKFCAVKTKDYLERNKEYRSLVFSVLKAYPMVTVFDAPAYLCDETWCWIRRGGDILYRDHDHLSIAGSRFLAKELISILDGASSRILEPSQDKATSVVTPPRAAE